MNIQGIHPMMMAPVKAESAGGSNSMDSKGSSSTSASDLQSTFLNLLVTELQNQDPTSPVDPTQMVSQMVSLNELNELVSINQTLKKMASESVSSAPKTEQNRAGVTVRKQPNSTSTEFPSNWVSMQPQIDSARQTASPGLMNLYAGFGATATTSNYNQTGAR